MAERRTTGFRTWRKRATALAAVALISATAAVTTSAPASAVLTRVGAANPSGDAVNFPAWYADANGVALQMCLDGVPNCLTANGDMAALHNAGGDAEAFYFNADAEVGPITVSNALEAMYAGDGADQEQVFVRTQVAAQTKGLQVGGVYTVTDPYGTLRTCTATDSLDNTLPASRRGWIRANACRTELVPAALDFNGALRGRVGPFLTWDTYGGAVAGAQPPAGYIGDNVTPHKVTGSPTGFNKVRITGPGINSAGSQNCAADWNGPVADCAETDLFVVQGKVQPGPSTALSTPNVSFGNITAPATKSVTLTSTGSEAVTVGTVVKEGSADFAITGNTCVDALGAGVVLAAGTSCKVDVTYTPTSGTQSGSVTITDSSGAPKVVSLSGSSTGLSSVTPASIAFGTQKATTTSVSEVATVENTGVAPLTVGTPTVTGTAASQFKITSNGCATPVAAGDGCEIGVAFVPASNGAKSATLNIPSDGGNRTVALTGTGTTPVVTVTPSAIAFADTASGSASATRAVTLTNSGNAPLTIDDASLGGANANQFRLGTNTCSVGTNLLPGSSCVTQVSFNPTSAGAKAGTLSLSADGGVTNVALSGTGLAPADVVAPTAPTGLRVTGTTTTAVNLSWTASTDNVGVTGYRVYRDGVAVGTSTTTSYSDTGLGEGTGHTYRVAAFDAATNESALSGSVTGTTATPITAPGAPTIGAPTAGNASATVRWTAPANNGGAAITGYSVRTFSGTTLVSTTPVGAVTSTSITGLANGTAYTFDVAATNSAGTGGFSARSAAVTPVAPATPVTVPGAPTIGAPTAGNAQATVRWTAPANNGGAAITGYSVRTFSGTTLVKTTPVGAVTSTAITGLTNGTAYTFDVAATNSAGTGAFSARSGSATPRTEFVAPTLSARTPGVNATAASTTANVTATFSEAVTGVSGTTFTLRDAAGTAVAGAVSYDATTRVATLNPTANLANDTKYTASLTNAVRDTAGNPLAPVTWTFTTGPRPTISARTPGVNATAVARTASPTVTFSEAVTGWSTTSVTMQQLSSTGTVVSTVTGTVSYNATTRVVTFNPFGTATTTLAANTRYRVNLTTGIRDAAGNPITATNWTFTTGA